MQNGFEWKARKMLISVAPGAELAEWSSTLIKSKRSTRIYGITVRFSDGHKCYRQIGVMSVQPSMADVLQAVNNELCKMVFDRKQEKC
jgi:uncharacterized protein YjfI (DUF2170 family)